MGEPKWVTVETSQIRSLQQVLKELQLLLGMDHSSIRENVKVFPRGKSEVRGFHNGEFRAKTITLISIGDELFLQGVFISLISEAVEGADGLIELAPEDLEGGVGTG